MVRSTWRHVELDGTETIQPPGISRGVTKMPKVINTVAPHISDGVSGTGYMLGNLSISRYSFMSLAM